MKKEFKFLKFLGKSILPAIGLAASVLVSIMPVSCVDNGGILIEETDEESPEVESTQVISENQFKVEFSEPVTIKDYFVEEEVFGRCEIEPITGDATKEVVVTFTKNMTVGYYYFFNGVAEDSHGNSLTFKLPFKAFNSRIPKLVINEVRNSYQRSTSGGTYKYKFEFVEFYAVTDGNLSGLEFQSANDEKYPKYDFPTIEVKAGDYIVLHLRNLEPNSDCVNEYDGDKTLAKATDSCDTAIDLWINNMYSRIGTTDILLLRNSMDGSVVDSLVMTTSDTTEWKENFAPYIAEVEASGTWVDKDGMPTCSIESAFDCSNISSSSVTRTISRQNTYEIPKEGKQVSKASDFIVTFSKGTGTAKEPGDTPGYKNSTNEYVKNII